MKPDWRELLDRVLDGESLTPQEAAALCAALSDPSRREGAVSQLRFRSGLFEQLSKPDADRLLLSRDRLLAKALLWEKALAARTAMRPTNRRVAGPPRFWFRWAGVAAVLIAVVTVLLLWGGGDPQPSARGDLSVFRTGRPVAAGDRLRRGDLVVAGQGGGELVLAGFGRVTMAPHAEVVLGGPTAIEELELLRGTLKPRIAPSRGEFTCHTPLGSVHVMDAEFVITVESTSPSPGDASMKALTLVTVAVLSGMIAFDLGGQSGTLGAGASRTFAAPPAAEVARLGIVGTGAPAGTVTLFAHGLPRGALQRTDSVVMQRLDDRTLLRTQMNPVTSWPDGSVKVALFAVEVPALAAEAALECVLLRGQAHPALGAPLDLKRALQGRKATITILPSRGSAWTYDLVAAAGDEDRWHAGPLAVSTRVETRVPAASLGGVTSVRLVADLIVTKDGILEVDSRLANDLMMKEGGGPATYAYKVHIDGAEVYSQAEAAHLQYTAWVRRQSRAASGAAPTRPWIRPDYDLLVRGGFTLPWDRSLPSANFDGYVTRVIAAESPNANQAYPAWGINRSAGAPGGRQEIGYRTYAGMAWLKTGDPAAQFLAHRQLEVGMSRPQNFWDDELGTWLNPEDWPKFTSGVPWQNTSPAGTPREEALGFPADQRPAANDREHVTVDHAHNADYWSVVALLSGRRMAFDGLAMNAAWQTIDHNDRERPEYRMNWRQLPLDYTTGIGWAPRLGSPQIRGFAWGLRDVSLAAALLPDDYPRREFYDRNALAWINSYGVNLDRLAAEQGELVGWVAHTNARTHVSGFMTSFLFYAMLDALQLEVAGPHGPALLEFFSKFRVNSLSSPDFNWRNAASGGDLCIGDGVNLFTTWKQAQARHDELGRNTPPDWSVHHHEGDWNRNVLAGLALLRDAPVPLELRAKAADAMVLYRSERQHGPGGFPRITPEAFFGPFENLNSLCPAGSTWRWDVPPVVRGGQSFTVSDPAAGERIGVVVTDGGLPRASRPEGSDAFAIVEQPAGSPFAISRGGVLRAAGRIPPGVHVIKVYATTYDNDGQEHRGPTVDVTITCTAGR